MNITFLFGSGADTDYCDKLPAGKAFTEALITEKYNDEVSQMMGLKDKGSFQIIYPASRKIYIQTIYENQKAAYDSLEKSDVDLCRQYYKDPSSFEEKKTDSEEEKKEKKEKKEYINNLCKGWYRLLKDDCNDDEGKQKIKNFFLTNGVFFDTLDGKFNSLRYDQLNSNAKRVMRAYATIYILMFKKLYNLDGVKGEEKFIFSYENIFNKLKEKYAIEGEDSCYYKILTEEFEDKKEYFVATTNYTNIVSDFIEKVIYLHGKMTWFEDLRGLTMYDCTVCDQKDKLLDLLPKNENEEVEKNNQEDVHKILPFIMIPSGVKPIICTRQIEEYSKFLAALEQSNILCILGYRFNSEDNHINSFITEWLRGKEKEKDRKLIYLNFNSEINMFKIPWIDDKFKFKQINVPEELFECEEKALFMDVDKNNSREVFKKLLQVIKNKY